MRHSRPIIRCIFCLLKKPGTEEHIFPFAIGGRLITDRVCGKCNSELGSRIDAASIDSFMVYNRRADLGLVGSSGKEPVQHEIFLRGGTLASDPKQRVKVTFNKRTKTLDFRVVHRAEDILMPDGSTARRITIDARDAAELPKIIQRERKRHRVRPLTPDELSVEVERFCGQVTTIEDPSIIIERTYSFAYVRHAMIKIAYELACLWLGDDYLDDPSAADIRTALLTPDPASTDRLPAAVMDASECGAFRLWDVGENHHLAYAWCSSEGIAIAIRVFDIHAAVVWVSRDAAHYLSGDDPDAKLRFLDIDPISRTMRDRAMKDEFARLASLMVAKRRTPPSDFG